MFLPGQSRKWLSGVPRCVGPASRRLRCGRGLAGAPDGPRLSVYAERLGSVEAERDLPPPAAAAGADLFSFRAGEKTTLEPLGLQDGVRSRGDVFKATERLDSLFLCKR